MHINIVTERTTLVDKFNFRMYFFMFKYTDKILLSPYNLLASNDIYNILKSV